MDGWMDEGWMEGEWRMNGGMDGGRVKHKSTCESLMRSVKNRQAIICKRGVPATVCNN